MLRILITFVTFLFSSHIIAADLSTIKQKCEAIGFKKNTEKFGDCVLKLRDRVIDNTKHTYQNDLQTIKNKQKEQVRSTASISSRSNNSEILSDLFDLGILLGAGYLLGTSIGTTTTAPNSSGIDPGIMCATGILEFCQ